MHIGAGISLLFSLGNEILNFVAGNGIWQSNGFVGIQEKFWQEKCD
jgi:hypothetical protein